MKLLSGLWRPYFHFKSMEYISFGNLHKTNWEDKDLVSMIVMRDPLERFLAGGKCGMCIGSTLTQIVLIIML